jgi:hypothetical protein
MSKHLALYVPYSYKYAIYLISNKTNKLISGDPEFLTTIASFKMQVLVTKQEEGIA